VLFSCTATGSNFIGPKERRHRNEDAAVLHVVRETRAKGMPDTRQAVQVKATQNARSRQKQIVKLCQVSETD
jgi:hypothetical protein